MVSQKGFGAILVILVLVVLFGIGSVVVTKKLSVQPKETPKNLVVSLNSDKKILPEASPSSVAITTTAAPSPTVVPTKVHLSDDPNTSISKIKLEIVVLLPQNVTLHPIDYWQDLLNTTYQNVAEFWTGVLNKQSSITFNIYPQIVPVSTNIEDENFSLASTQAMQAVNITKQPDEYVIWFVYLLQEDAHYLHDSNGRGGHIGDAGVVVESTSSDFGGINAVRDSPAEEAHEMGHALGLQHSSDDLAIRAKYAIGTRWTSNCDLMLGQGFNHVPDYIPGAKLAQVYCILPEQQALFFK